MPAAPATIESAGRDVEDVALCVNAYILRRCTYPPEAPIKISGK
jgi:hypothetical protein